MSRSRPLIPLLLACLSLIPLATPPAHGVTDQEVGQTIERMQNWFYSKQDPATGEWKRGDGMSGNNVYGEHVLVTYAMIASGQSPQDPRMAKAIRFLREHELMGTYARSLSAHVWASLPDAYLPNLGDDAKWLLDAQTDSVWGYSGQAPKPGKPADHSTTQYGILGLWEFSKRGGKTSAELWEDAVVHFLDSQLPDGGWAYRSSMDSARGSMTAAGLTVLYVALQELYRDADRPPQPIVASINRGMAWLDKNFSGSSNPGGSHIYYYLYGIERVALASGVKRLNGKDWFEAGAAHILKQEKDGSIGDSFVNTAFALGFLARGRVPIWISKIQVPGIRWNNRPNDIYFLTRFLSDLREAELNWQQISIDMDASLWNNAPVAYLSSDQAVNLTDEQVANLRKYLDMGGMLMANSESRTFQASMEALTDRLYPGAKLEALPEDHPLYTMIAPVSQLSRRSLVGYGNGARDLIVMSTRDMSMTLQSDRSPGNDDIWKIMTNLYVLATDRGTPPNRLVEKIPQRQDRAAKGTIRVARAQYDGQWDMESRSWVPLENVLFNRSGLELEWVDASLDSLEATDAALVHLAGVNRVELTDAQKQSIKQYVEAGGTLLVETIGGRGDFSVGVEEQLRGIFDRPATPIALYEPLLTGEGLEHAFNIRRVVYRPYSVIHMAARSAPRLAAISIDQRPGVIFSHEDLSLGVLGVQRWGINGYQSDAARELLTNIVLTAAKQ